MLTAAGGLLLSGCSKDTATESFPPSDSGESSGCCVTLSFSSDGPLHAGRGASAAYGSGAAVPGGVPDTVWGAGSSTRGVVNPSIVDEWAVYDLWVLQYDMSGGAAGSLAARRYVASTVQDGSSVRITADLEPMEKARIVVLANVPGMFTESELPTGSTLADLAALTFPINSTSGSGLPEDYSPALPMRGDSGEDLKLEMGQTAVVRIPLYRLVSKVNFTVDNRCSEGWPRLTLTDVSLRNVPASGSYGFVTASTHASTRYPAAASDNFKNYDGIADGLGNHCELLWYLAPNSRGTGSGTTPADKTAVNAPSGGDYCTYAYVEGMIQSEEDAPLIPMSYRVYLGANSYNDYNVWSNEAYRVKLTIRELFWVEGAVVLPAGDIPVEGKAVSLTLTGTLPSEGVVVRANISGADPVTGMVTASGTAVELAVPANDTGAARTVTFEYLWNGTWIQIGDSRTQQGYNVTTATHNAPATIPGQGATYNVTLTGALPSSVDVRASSGGTALITKQVTASGTAVQLAVPANKSYSSRTVTFEYKWGNEWKRIQAACSQQGYNVTTATHNAPATIPGQGATYNVTLTGALPSSVDVRASSGGTALITKQVTASGTAVQLAVPANKSYSSRTVTFEYKWGNEWKRIQAACSQQGYNVTTATHNAPATIPGQGATYNVTLTGALPSSVDVRASSGGTALITKQVTASGTAVQLAVPANKSYSSRTVTFEYKWGNEWKRIQAACSQQGYNVTATSVTPAGDIPGAGGTYTVKFTGWGGYKIRAVSGNTELVVKNDYEEVVNYSASIAIPAFTQKEARSVTFQYSQEGEWKSIETRTQVIQMGIASSSTWRACNTRCQSLGGILADLEEARAVNWNGWWVSHYYWTAQPGSMVNTYLCYDSTHPDEPKERAAGASAYCRCKNE